MINKLEVATSPDVLIGLNRLERVLIDKTTLVEMVTIIPKGNFLKLKGSICGCNRFFKCAPTWCRYTADILNTAQLLSN